jgi:hypothetical protein
MITLDIRPDFRAVERQLGILQDGMRDRVIAAAINKTTDKARAEMTRQITGEFNIKAKDVRAQLKVRRASWKGGMLVAELEAMSSRPGGRSLNLIHFAARQTSKGVTVKVKRGGPRKLIPGAWIGNDGRTVFQRVGKQRLPIKGLQTIDVPQMFNARRLNAAVVRKIQTDLPIEVGRALTALATRAQG